ncbi:Dynein heavy chain 6, axonemal [Triplophysa tibetana]|uniref:Dynein heavy chain 6, axonemal n=1 Tax=Triplophysa tibetana TaxID=1572043 RepID=A0A5A9NHA3_9TELE|nr:Dynein heavy chain 6, axonemal [Triplophysa tibetana]
MDVYGLTPGSPVTLELPLFLEELQDSLDSASKIWEETSHQSLLEENQLSQLEKQSGQLQQQVHDAFKQVSPLFQAAVEALQSLSHSDLDEVRRYRTPPEGVVAVMDIICMLFNRSRGWENSRQLLMQSSFFEELEFFDCSTLSAEMIKTLGQIVQAPSFQPSFVRDLSRACESLCCWLRAVYQYARVQHRMAPQMARKQDLDELMVESRARLSVSRLQEMSEHDRLQELEKQLELNRQDMILLKLKLSTAEEHEMETSATLKMIERHIEDWNSAQKEVDLDRQNIPGDALILAATVTYLGPFRPDVRQELLQKWHKLCLTGAMHDVNLTTSTCVPIPVNKEYQKSLNRVLGLDLCLIPGDYSDLVRSVVSWGHRVGQVQRWPLLADVHQHELMNSQTLLPTGGKEEYHREEKYGLVVSADDPALLDKLNHAAEEGLGVLVTHIERAIANIKILQPFVQTAASVFLSQCRSVKAAHPDFRLFMSTPLPVPALINEIHHSFLDEVQIINLSLSPSEVRDLILTELMKSESSEVWTLHRQVQIEKRTLQHKLSQNEVVSLMEYVVRSSTPLLQDNEFLPHVLTCQSVSLKLEAKIKELSQEIDHHKSLMADFRRVADLTTALYNALQDVAQLSPCYLFTLPHFLLTLRPALIEGSPDVSLHGRTPVIADITNRIVSQLISQYKCCLFQSHATLFRLLISVALIVHSEGCSEAEQDIFLRGLRKEHFLSPSTQSVPELPSWVPTQVQADVYLLETIAPFGGLVSSLIGTSKLWQEYLHFPSSTVIGPVPCQSHSHLSTMQRAILWKTLCPNRLAAVEEDLAACTQSHLHPVVATGLPMGCPEELSQLLSKNVGPVVVELPNKNEEEHMSVHPLYLIQQAARYQSHKKGVEVNVISFGSDCLRDAVLPALDTAVQNGHWLVLNNCHLLDCWDVRVVDKLTQLVSCKVHVTDVESNGPFLNSVSAGKTVHPNFRLWLITKGDRPHSVPAAVRISALHLVCDSSWDLKDVLWSSVRLALSESDTSSSSAHTESTERSLQQCAVLHSVLLQRQAFRHLGQGQLYLWTQEDLLAMIDAHDRIRKHCSETAEALEYIAETGSLLKRLSHRIHRITDCTDPIILGFSPDMAGKLMKLKSKTLNILRHQSQIIYTEIREDTRILLQSQELPECKKTWERLLTLQDKLRQKITDIGVDMGSAYLSHLRQFLQTEWQFLYKLVSFVLWDNFQPAKYNLTNSTPVNVTSAALSRLESRANLLGSYSWEESSRPHAYQLSAFLNPQGFLVALIRDVASIQKKDISVLSLHFKVLTDTSSPSSPSQNGVCLCGLQLQGALWDPGSAALKDTFSPKPSYFPPLWVWVEERTDDESLNSSTLPLYSCPLYVDADADGYQRLSADNIITHVPLSTRFLRPLKVREHE